MAKLSTKSSADDFRDNFDNQFSAMTHLGEKLPSMHRSIQQRSAGNYGYGRQDYPDKLSYDVAFSTSLAMLARIVHSIREAEEVVEAMYEEGDEGSDELAHAQGELFAAKKMYLELVPVIGKVESSRLGATSYGMKSGEFLTSIGRNRDIPQFRSEYTAGHPRIGLSLDSDSKSSNGLYMVAMPPPLPF